MYYLYDWESGYWLGTGYATIEEAREEREQAIGFLKENGIKCDIEIFQYIG